MITPASLTYTFYLVNNSDVVFQILRLLRFLYLTLKHYKFTSWWSRWTLYQSIQCPFADTVKRVVDKLFPTTYFFVSTPCLLLSTNGSISDEGIGHRQVCSSLTFYLTVLKNAASFIWWITIILSLVLGTTTELTESYKCRHFSSMTFSSRCHFTSFERLARQFLSTKAIVTQREY